MPLAFISVRACSSMASTAAASGGSVAWARRSEGRVARVVFMTRLYHVMWRATTRNASSAATARTPAAYSAKKWIVVTVAAFT